MKLFKVLSVALIWILFAVGTIEMYPRPEVSEVRSINILVRTV